MNYEDITFDSFMSLHSKTRKKVLNDTELLKILIRKNIKKSRYEHSVSVAETARDLALCHHVDPDKDLPLLEEYLKYYDKEKLNGITGAYHSWAAPYYLKEKTNFHDKDILRAIYNHTICNSRDKLSMSLYIADKREPLRGIDDDIIRLARKDLIKAFKMLNWNVERYIKEVKNERFIENRI